MSEHDPESAAEWLRYASTDLRAAQALRVLAGQEWTVCFHAQQAAEKALKGYLAYLAVDDIPRTHDLGVLAELAVQHGGVAPPADAARLLSAYAVGPRYPGPPSPTAEDASEAIASAERVYSFAEKQTAVED